MLYCYLSTSDLQMFTYLTLKFYLGCSGGGLNVMDEAGYPYRHYGEILACK